MTLGHSPSPLKISCLLQGPKAGNLFTVWKTIHFSGVELLNFRGEVKINCPNSKCCISWFKGFREESLEVFKHSTKKWSTKIQQSWLRLPTVRTASQIVADEVEVATNLGLFQWSLSRWLSGKLCSSQNGYIFYPFFFGLKDQYLENNNLVLSLKHFFFQGLLMVVCSWRGSKSLQPTPPKWLEEWNTEHSRGSRGPKIVP